MPSSATVCFVLAAVYCIANILVVRKSTRWSNQMWAGGSSNGRTRIMFKSFWDASVCRSSGCGCCCVVSGILPLQESKKMCKVFAYQNPSMHFDSLYTSLHFVQQCLAPQQYVSCWLRFIALQTFLSSEKAPVGQIRCGPVGRQTAAQESCSNHFGCFCL